MDYFEKYDANPAEELKWNVPEKRMGTVTIAGGNGQNFRTPVKIAEYLGANYPLEHINVVLPDVLQDKLPPAPGLVFLKSTESGSFADSEELTRASEVADYSIFIGDFSKNAVTGRAVASACENSASPLLITRDSVDLVAENNPEKALINDKVVFVASAAQLQKLLHAIYYPRMLTLSQSLVQVAETLHKLTLSYPAGIVTLYSGQILAAKDGVVAAVPLEKSGYSPIMLWSGELAAKIMAMNLYNPNNFIKATLCAIFS